MRNSDISFFFLSQLILPPVVLALPFLVLYKAGAARHAHRADPALHAHRAADRHLDHARPVRRHPDRARGGCAGGRAVDLGRLRTIVLPIALPGMVAAFILSLVLTWNEYFFAALLTSTHANTLPVMVASQTGSQGISWWSMAALSFAAILPLIVIGILLGALHHQGHGRRRGEVARLHG
jgi:multiple sugar transport system permease protein